jgi:hypothetical protein
MIITGSPNDPFLSLPRLAAAVLLRRRRDRDLIYQVPESSPGPAGVSGLSRASILALMIGKQRSGVFLSYARTDAEDFAATLRERLPHEAPDIWRRPAQVLPWVYCAAKVDTSRNRSPQRLKPH